MAAISHSMKSVLSFRIGRNALKQHSILRKSSPRFWKLTIVANRNPNPRVRKFGKARAASQPPDLLFVIREIVFLGQSNSKLRMRDRANIENAAWSCLEVR